MTRLPPLEEGVAVVAVPPPLMRAMAEIRSDTDEAAERDQHGQDGNEWFNRHAAQYSASWMRGA